MEKNTKIVDKEAVEKEMDTIMNRMPEFGTKWEDPEEEDLVDKFKKEYLDK